MKKYTCEICNKEFDNQLEFARHCVECHKKHATELLEEKRTKDEERIYDLYKALADAINQYKKDFPNRYLYIQNRYGDPVLVKSVNKGIFHNIW